MILLIDNYDSFSYNLYQLIGSVNPDIRVIRNDERTVEEIEAMGPELIVLSPGPGKPSRAGVCEEVVRKLSGRICKTADARKDLGSLSGRGKPPFPGDGRLHTDCQVSFAGGGAGEHTGGASDNCQNGRRGSDGRGTPGISCIWCPVSSGIGADARRNNNN